MYRLFGILVIVLGGYLPLCAQGSGDADITKANIKMEWGEDTLWYINKGYDVYTQKYELTIDGDENLPVNKYYKINWGDGSPIGGVAALTNKFGPHLYSNPGVFEIKIEVYNDVSGTSLSNTYYRMVMNKELTAKFKLEPDPFKYCLDSGGDSLLLVMTEHNNPPATNYEIIFDSKAIGVAGVVDTLGGSQWFGENKDSAWIVFTQPTGIYGTDIVLRMTYKDEKKKIDMEAEVKSDKKVYIYQTPDINKMFGFADTLIDPDERPANFEVCTDMGQSFLQLDMAALLLYQYKPGNASAYPYYNSISDTNDFSIQYYYKEDLKDADWKNVTGDWKYVDTTRTIGFYKGGFYKLRITASNKCNTVDPLTGLLIADTLWTEKVWQADGTEGERYFQVSESDINNMFCLNDTLCLNQQDTIVFVDRNERRGYDAPPTYSITISGFVEDRDYSVKEKIYKNGAILAKEDAANEGCDSTRIILTINTDSLIGQQVVWLTRTSACNTAGANKSFKLHIGRIPTTVRDTLYKTLRKEYSFVLSGDKYHRCDSFRYILQDELWNYHAFKKDSLFFYFGKGSKKDTIDYDVAPLTYYDFDSTGNTPNYIHIRTHNYCGWGEELKAEFYTRTRPDVSLWRDSIPENDSLCVKFSYPYHWVGKLPDNYIVAAKFDVLTKVNGIEFKANETKEIADHSFSVMHHKTGRVEELFRIQNLDMKSCLQVIDTVVYLITPPDTLIYPDSIRYCNSLVTINTEKFFDKDEKEFKWSEWSLNSGSIQKGLFPLINVTGAIAENTLDYKLSNSKGCYIKGQLMIRPETPPLLKLQDDVKRCLPDTIKEIKGTANDFVTQMSSDEKYKLSVYRNNIAEALLVYQDGMKDQIVLHDYQNGQDLVYVMTSKYVDTAFMDKCKVEDRIKLSLSQPKLKILRDADLVHPWEKFKFEVLKTNGVDTADLNATTIAWKHLPDMSIVSGTGLCDRIYNLSHGEEAKDSLLFELSAQNLCGEELKDTLAVILTKLKLIPYKDTICSNVKEYPLWGKMKAENLDEASVTWKVVYPENVAKQGTLTPLTGIGAKYTPAEDVDSVRIYVEGALKDVSTVKIGDTIVLKVNPAPRFKFNVDTLMICGKELVLEDIAVAHIDTMHCAGLRKGGCVPPENPVGGWSGNNYTFAMLNPANFNENMVQDISIKALGLPGCADVLDTVTLVNPVYAKPTFKRQLEEMCSGDLLKLDTIYTIKGKDRYTHFEWGLQNEQGNFIHDTLYYEAGVPQDQVQKMTLYTYKSYECYTGNPSGKQLVLPKQELRIIVHREPLFHVAHKYDTLCRASNEMTINRDWVYVEPSYYPDYKDSLQINGRQFKANMPYLIAREGQHDTLVVTVAQGMCSKWEKTTDTIFLYRLPSMISGDFTVADVCIGNEAVLPEASTLLHVLTKRSSWTATGGTIIGSAPPQFRPDDGVNAGTVTLRALPSKTSCGYDELTRPVNIFSRPKIDLQPDTMCAVVGQARTIVPVISGNNLLIQKVEWYRSGEEATILKTSSVPNESWQFILENKDIVNGKVELVEKVTSGGVCAGIDYDTLKIALQRLPNISVNSDLSVCQGSAIDLSTEIQTQDAGKYTLTLDVTNPGVLNGTYYAPGEFFGKAAFTVKAEGLHGCLPATKNFEVKVKSAPMPDMQVDPLTCQKDTIHFKAINLPGGVSAVCSWKFGDGSEVKTGKEVYNIYSDFRDYNSTLTVAYGTGCSRQVEKKITVYVKPQAAFDIPQQVGINKVVEFTDMSVPSGLTCYWNMSDGGSYNISPCTHVFTGSMGKRVVRLKVKTAEGCWDTVSHSTIAVVPPVPKFNVAVDSCLGKVNIINQSDSNYAQVIAWNFANGTSVSNIWNPITQHYNRVYKDTVYQISLTLKNTAGEATYSVPVKMISRLKAGVEILPVSDICNKLEKEIHILTEGRPDTTQIWWGDKQYQEWTGDKVQVLKHKYVNDTTIALYYPLVLAVTNACEKDTTEPIPVTVYPVSIKARVIADTTYKNECYGQERGFVNKSFGFTPEGYSCEWKFEKDIESNTDEKVVHLFEVPGTYVVKLRVKDNCNEDSDSVKIVVHGNDSLDFVLKPELLCTGQEVDLKFVQHGAAAFGNFRWTFPDGIKRTGSEVTYLFPDAGKQQVKLTAVADGCQSTFIRTLQLNRTPQAIINTNGYQTVGCSPLKIPFYGTNGNNEECTALWDFKDNSFSDLFTVEDKVFETSGDYDVVFRLMTTAGCIDTVMLPVKVLFTPDANMKLRQQLFCTADGNFVTSAVNLTPQPEDCAFEWWQDNVRLSLLPDSVRLNFTQFFGKSAVKLKVTHKDSHCESFAEDTVLSAHQVVAKLTVNPSDICAGATVIFENTSEFGGGNMDLALGDGTEQVTENIFEHVYEDPGDYDVKLTVANQEGCVDSLELSVRVHSLPEAFFSWTKDNSIVNVPESVHLPKVDNGGIRFTNESIYEPHVNEATEMTYQWQFGDLTAVSNEKNPTHVFANNGMYEVWLYTETVYGCRDSISDVVDIATVKGLYFPNAFAPAAADEGVNRFLPKGIGLHSYLIRIYAQGGLCVWSSEMLTDGRPAEFWDGTFNGRPMPKGVYNYEVTAIFIDGTVWNKVNGSVTLIR